MRHSDDGDWSVYEVQKVGQFMGMMEKLAGGQYMGVVMMESSEGEMR